MWEATPALSLIQKDHSIRVWIEWSPHVSGATGTRPAVKHERRSTLWVSTRFPINLLTISNVEHSVLVRLDVGIERSRDQDLLNGRIRDAKVVRRDSSLRRNL